MYYVRHDNKTVGCKMTTDHPMSSYGAPVLVDSTGIAYGAGDIDKRRLYWSASEAGKAWGVTREDAVRVMPTVPGYRYESVNGRRTHMVPHGSEKP